MRKAAVARLHAKSGAYRKKVEQSLDAVRAASQKGRVGISFSGGKDSLVTLHLVRSLMPSAPAALFDSGCELPETLELADTYDAQLIRPRLTYPEMARFSGWWGYANPVDKGCPFDVKGMLIDEPAETFVVKERLSVCAMGLRGEESRGRKMNAMTRGMLYKGADRTWYLCPLAFWTAQDVWTYIHEHELRYHPIYDRMEVLGVPEKEQRLGMSLGMIALQQGRVAIFRRVAPQHFARLAAEFPKLRDAT